MSKPSLAAEWQRQYHAAIAAKNEALRDALAVAEGRPELRIGGGTIASVNLGGGLELEPGSYTPEQTETLVAWIVATFLPEAGDAE
ncbi:MAG: hypothetical protein ACKVT1_02435 [Dehalococcoidia bacterium]